MNSGGCGANCQSFENVVVFTASARFSSGHVKLLPWRLRKLTRSKKFSPLPAGRIYSAFSSRAAQRVMRGARRISPFDRSIVSV